MYMANLSGFKFPNQAQFVGYGKYIPEYIIKYVILTIK